MSKPNHRLPPELRTVLDDDGSPWQLEERRKHMLLRVNGRAVLVLPRGSPKKQHRVAIHNAVAELKRHLKENKK